MSELKTVLGFEAGDAIATLTAMETSLRSWTTAMRNAASAASTFNKVSGIDKGMNSAATSTEKAEKAASRYYNKLQKESKTAATAVESGAKKQEEAGKRVLLSWQSVVRIFAIQVIHQAVTRITTAMWEGVSAARDYEISLAEIQTIGEGFRADFEGLAAQVREFSNATGAPIEGVAEGVYQTLSNQVTDTAHAFDFMTASQAFATASVTETSASVALLSSVINSYNENIDQATKIGGKLAKIIQLGRLRGEEFADSFGKIIVLAAQIGISFDEVGAAIATLTVSGLKYNEASTLMLNIMLKLIRPTEELQKRYTELGIASSEAGIQAYGFQGFLDKLSEKAGTSATELGKLFNRVRAIRGVMGLANENAEVYLENLADIEATTAEELFKKRDIIFDTNAKQVEIELNKLRNTMIDGFGRSTNEALGTLFDTFGGGVETMEALGVAATTAVVAFAALKAQAIAASIAMGTASAAFAPAAIVVGVAIAATALFAFFNRAATEAKELRAVYEEESKKALKVRIDDIREEAKVQKKVNDEALSNIQKYLFEKQRLSNIANERIIRTEEYVFSNIAAQLSNKIGEINSFFSNLEKRAVIADKVIRKLNESVRLMQFDISDFNFERETRSLEPLQKAYVNLERSTAHRLAATNALQKGDLALAELYFERAKVTANIALSTADESKNQRAIQLALRATQTAYKDEIAILGRKKQLTTDEKKQIENVADQISVQRVQLKLLEAEIKNVAKEFAEVRLDPIKRAEIIAKTVGLTDEIQGILHDVKIKFDFDFTEVPSTFADKIRTGIESSLQQLDAEYRKIEAPQTATDVGLRELFPGAKTDEERSAAAVELAKLLDASAKSTVERAQAENTISAGLNNNVVLLERLQDAYADSAERASVFGLLFRSGGQLAGMDIAGPFDDAKEKADQARFAMDLVTEAVILLRAETLDLDIFKGTEEALANLAATPGTAREVKAIIKELLVNLHEIEKAKLLISEKDLIVMTPEEEAAAEAKLTYLNEKAIEAAAAGAYGVNTAEKTIQVSLKKTTELAKERNAALMGAMTPTPTNQRFGGLLYRADGGFTPRGTDTIPAMLSPGEYVMDARNTSKFFSQLQSMSAGVQPVYRAQGGPVTNIGDIAITVNETASAQQTARETMQAFRRQTRRRTATL